MKKYMVLLLLGLVLFMLGCEKETITAPESYPIIGNNLSEEDSLSKEYKTDEGIVVEQVEEENLEENASEDYRIEEVDAYISSIEHQSEQLNTSLAEEELTQTEMNETSQAIYQLWDEALNFLWGELKVQLSEEEFKKLKEEQLLWIEDKEKLVSEAGKEFEGGTLYSLVVNGEAARLTQERVYQLYEVLVTVQP
ncbi:MAG: DUF1311 domain-containing protein [Lachnospiraceae bacterium]|nr:DUF1311 domain-containing protein [Lachnospiraceae bacterium]